MKKDQLHSLIRNLTKSEKRYYRLFSKRSGDKAPKNYIHLFEILEGMEFFSEESLINQLKTLGINTDYIAADKNYLYISILDALRAYNANYSAKQQVRRQLDFVDILSEKGLFPQATKVLKKAKNIALNNDASQYLPEILQAERKLSGSIVSEKELAKVQEELEESHQKVDLVFQNEFYYRKNNLFRLRYGKTTEREALLDLENRREEMRLKNGKDSPVSAQMWFLRGEAVYFYIKDNIKKELETNRSLLLLMENTKSFVKANPLEYVSVFSRILILSKQTAPLDYPKLLGQFLDFADSVNRENKKVKARVYTLAYSTEMVRIIQERDFIIGPPLIEKVKSVMERYADLIDPAFCLNNYYKFAYICIGLDRYEEASEYLNILINEYSSSLRPDIYGYAKILLCLCNYEARNFPLLEHLTRTAKYYLRKENRLFETEKLLLRFLHSLAKKKRKKPNFGPLAEQIAKLPPGEKAQNYFDFNRWIQGQVEGIKFSEVRETQV